MVASTFDAALRRLLLHEGGYSNHPSDPGGPTNFGITIADYRRYVNPRATPADVKAMHIDEAKAIYRQRYWDALRCDELPAGLDYAVFDYGVNSGIGRAGKVLRRLLDQPDGTHAVSDEVLRAVARRDPMQLVAAMCDERLAFLKRLKTWPVFGPGWGRRVAEVRAEALDIAKRAAASRNRKTGAVVAAGAVVASGAAVQEASSGGMGVAVAVAVLIAAIALIAFFAWRRWRRVRQEAV